MAASTAVLLLLLLRSRELSAGTESGAAHPVDLLASRLPRFTFSSKDEQHEALLADIERREAEHMKKLQSQVEKQTDSGNQFADQVVLQVNERKADGDVPARCPPVDDPATIRHMMQMVEAQRSHTTCMTSMPQGRGPAGVMVPGGHRVRLRFRGNPSGIKTEDAPKLAAAVQTVVDQYKGGTFGSKTVSVESDQVPNLFDFETNWKTVVEGNECPFSLRGMKPPHPPDYGSFSEDGYRFVQFLYSELFLKHGWIPIPVAGTALGVLRHHGMYEYDDDLDIVLFPPLKYMTDFRTAEETSGSANYEATWKAVYDDFETLLKEYGQQYEDGMGNGEKFGWTRTEAQYNGKGATSTSHRNNEVKGWSVKTRPQNPLHEHCPYRAYHRCVNQTWRSCGAHYQITLPNPEMRRMFFVGKPCAPNHVFVCIQPSVQLYERFNGPKLFTVNEKRSMDSLCKCRFGPTNFVCPRNLLEFVTLWYGDKWCVPTGPVRDTAVAHYKSWND